MSMVQIPENRPGFKTKKKMTWKEPSKGKEVKMKALKVAPKMVGIGHQVKPFQKTPERKGVTGGTQKRTTYEMARKQYFNLGK